MQEYAPIGYEDSSHQGNTSLPSTGTPIREGNQAGMKKRASTFH